MAINLEKSTATATFKPLVMGGGNPAGLGEKTPLCANVKADLQGFGNCHVLASRNFHAMAQIIARQYGCTVQRCGYAANPGDKLFSVDGDGQLVVRAQDARELLHVVLHGNDCERAAYVLQWRFLRSLSTVVAKDAAYARNMRAGDRLKAWIMDDGLDARDY